MQGPAGARRRPGEHHADTCTAIAGECGETVESLALRRFGADDHRGNPSDRGVPGQLPSGAHPPGPRAHRPRAKALGYLIHFCFGLLFASGYYLIFSALGRAGWLLGTGLGLPHGLFAGSALVNVLLPVVHTRMGTPLSSVDSKALLEPPGLLMLNYGHQTPLVTLVTHLGYGALVGGFAALSSRRPGRADRR